MRNRNNANQIDTCKTLCISHHSTNKCIVLHDICSQNYIEHASVAHLIVIFSYGCIGSSKSPSVDVLKFICEKLAECFILELGKQVSCQCHHSLQDISTRVHCEMGEAGTD